MTVLAVLGGDRGYDWYSAQCGATPEMYPELGWLLFVMPLSIAGALGGAFALGLEWKRHPPETWLPWAILVVAILLGGGAAILSAIMLLNPCAAAAGR